MIPSGKNAIFWKRTCPGSANRNDAVLACKRFEWHLWKVWSNYHQCSLVETNMHGFKRLGDRVIARTFGC